MDETPKKRRDMGPLHALLTRGLPDWIDDRGLLMVHDLSKELNVSYQAMYKQFQNGRISRKHVETLVLLSERSRKGADGFVPLVREDFWSFVR